MSDDLATLNAEREALLASPFKGIWSDVNDLLTRYHAALEAAEAKLAERESDVVVLRAGLETAVKMNDTAIRQARDAEATLESEKRRQDMLIAASMKAGSALAETGAQLSQLDREGWTKAFDEANDHVLKEEIERTVAAEARAEAAEQRERALTRYVHHSGRCDVVRDAALTNNPPTVKLPCICGLAELLDGVPIMGRDG